MQTNLSDFHLTTGEVLSFSVMDGELLFLHSKFLSSQLPLNNIGVSITHETRSVSISFQLFESPTYQRWSIASHEFNELVAYFTSIGFTISNPDPHGYANALVIKELH